MKFYILESKPYSIKFIKYKKKYNKIKKSRATGEL